MLSSRGKASSLSAPGIFNAGALRELLANANGVKGAGAAGHGGGNVDEMIKAILQDSGVIGAKRKSGKKKKQRKFMHLDKASGLGAPSQLDPLDRARAQRNMQNSIHQLGAAAGLAGDDVIYVEKQFAQVKKIVAVAAQKLQDGYTQLCGTDDGGPNSHEMHSLFMADDASLLLLFVGIELDEQALTDVCSSAEILPSGSPSREEKQMNQDGEGGTPLDFKTWQTGVLAWLRQHLMAGLLAERRGEIQSQFLETQTTAYNKGGMGTASPPHATPQPPYSSSSYPSSHMTYAGAVRPPVAGTASELFEASLLQVQASSATVRGVKGVGGSRRPSLTDSKLGGAGSSTIGPGVGVGGFSSSSSTLYGGMSQTSSVASGLPPLRIKQRLKDVAKKKSLMDSAGFNASFTRNTPRCLRDELNPGGKTIDMLRNQLRMAQEGLTQLNTMVDEGIVWVHKNTDVVGLSGGVVSTRTKDKCHKMAVERLFGVLGGALLSAKHWTFLRWRRVCQYEKVSALAKRYSRIKGIEITTRVLYEALTRQFLRGWAPWLRKVQTQQRWEQEAAVTEIQRMVRAFCGRRRAKRMRRFHASLRVQCMFRCFKARRRVRMRRAYLRVFRAACRIQWLVKSFVLRAKARREVVKRKKVRFERLKVQREKERLAQTRAAQKRRAEEEEKARKQKEIEDLMKEEKRDPKFKGRAPPGKNSPESKSAQAAKPQHISGTASKQAAAQKAKLHEENEKNKKNKKLTPVEEEEKRKEAQEARRRQKEEDAAAKAAEDALRRARMEAEAARIAQEEADAAAAQAAASEAAAEAARAALFKEELDKAKPASSILGSIGGLMGGFLGGSKAAAPAPVPTPSPQPVPLAVAAEDNDENASVASSITAGTGFPVAATGAGATPGSTTRRLSFDGLRRLSFDRAPSPAARAPSPSVSSPEARATTPTGQASVADPEKERLRLEKEEKDRVAAEEKERKRLEKEEKDRLAAEERERLRLEKEEKDRIAAEEKAKAAAESAEKKRLEKEEKDRLAAEEKERKRLEKEEKDRVAAEEKERLAAEAAEKKRLDKEEKNRIAAEVAEKKRIEKEEKDRVAAEEKERKRLEKEALAASKPQTPGGGGMFSMFSRPSTAAAASSPSPGTGAATGPPTPTAKAGSKASPTSPKAAASATPQQPTTPGGSSITGMFSNIFKSGAGDGKQAPKSKKAAKKPKKGAGPPPTTDEAILRLQLFGRVWKANKRIKARREQVIKEHKRAGQLILWAVVVIQSVARMRQGRIRYNNFWAIYQKDLAARKLYSAVLLQKTARGLLGRRRAKMLWKERAEEIKAEEWKKYQSESNRRAKQKAKEIEDAERAAGIKAQSRAVPTAAEVEANPGLLYSGIDIEQVKEIDEKIARMEELERRLADKERAMNEAAKQAEDRQASLERALKVMEERAKAEEAERAVQKELLAMAAGPLASGRSPYASARGSARGSARAGGGMPSARPSARDQPPTARSARGGAGIPPDAPKITHEGKTWCQLWDPDERANYWYCEITQEAQWEEPGKPVGYESGYESSGAMTDYSTDHYTSGGSVSGSEWGDDSEWQEFWDESAQAKYWYNNSTGEATWTKPPELGRNNAALVSIPASARSDAASAMDWVSYIDEETGQEYWYNAKTVRYFVCVDVLLMD